jgi:hypothetical protein
MNGELQHRMDFDLYNKQENSTGVNEQGMSIQNKQLF